MRKRILVIDDTLDALEIAKAYLEDEFDVAVAHDGKEGVERALEFKPHLIMTDLMMQTMHGYQVCEKVRAEPTLSETRILVVSSKAFQNDKDLAKQAGADSYLVKPYLRKDLFEKIGELLGPDAS
ncbi:response regulator [Elusimicrobiota bacterium]